jgi:hypothetical protein
MSYITDAVVEKTPRSDAFHEDEIRTELESILHSDIFSKSERMRRFLRFVVEQYVTSGEHRLKEYVIALEVFDRPESFDPRSDSIVRVEARRLRSKLDQYYATEGGSSRWRIRMPAGSYVPEFGDDSVTCKSTPAKVSRHHRVSVGIIPFTPFANDDTSGDGSLREELERRVIYRLIKQAAFDLVVWPERDRTVERFAWNRHGGLRTDLVVRGAIETSPDGRKAILELLTFDSMLLWSSQKQMDAGPHTGEHLAQALCQEMLRYCLARRPASAPLQECAANQVA